RQDTAVDSDVTRIGARHSALEHRLVIGKLPRSVKQRRDRRAGACPHRGQFRPMRASELQRFAYLSAGAQFEDKAVLAVTDQLWNATDAGANHRNAVGAGFDDHGREAIVVCRRDDTQIDIAKELGRIDVSQELHAGASVPAPQAGNVAIFANSADPQYGVQWR